MPNLNPKQFGEPSGESFFEERANRDEARSLKRGYRGNPSRPAAVKAVRGVLRSSVKPGEQGQKLFEKSLNTLEKVSPSGVPVSMNKTTERIHKRENQSRVAKGKNPKKFTTEKAYYKKFD